MNSLAPFRQIDPQRASVYAPEVTAQVPRLLSLLDRETPSASYGSFDREHWSWKYRDFPITMLQPAFYPLALLWKFPFPDNPYYGNPQVFQWITAAIENTCHRQHKNGAFDSVGPFTQDYGVTLAIVHCLSETRRVLAAALPPGLENLLRTTVQRGVEFALPAGEDYAFITNHQALFAVAFLDAFELLKDTRCRQRAEEIIEQILREQSSDGWYREYEGPDPGYESLGIFYLATYWKRTGSVRVLESLQRSIKFYASCVHPDGSVGGVYGSRHTQLYFPAGLEILTGEIPLAAAVAKFMRKRLARGNVLTPAASDAENLLPLATTYLEACLMTGAESSAPVPLLPCEIFDGLRHFPDSGITVAATKHYYAVMNTAKGGVCRVFDKSAGKVVYEDAGYLVRAGGRQWSSQFTGLGRRADAADGNQVTCTTQFAEVREELPTPGKFLLLRLLNLTLFRSLALGAWLRRKIVARLITNKRPVPLRLHRSVIFTADEIRFCDRLELAQSVRVASVALPRSFTAIHMGSAKYFHPSELEGTPELPVRRMAGELSRERRAQCEFTVRFSVGGEPRLVIESVASETQRAHAEALLRP